MEYAGWIIAAALIVGIAMWYISKERKIRAYWRHHDARDRWG